tara:strand:+ start:437 stop:1501 length:1065 start_codon:yes stop_codon:yes gene_type:complete
MAIDFKTFLSVVSYITDARFPVLIRGRHGIGKSSLVYQKAAELGLEVVERRASQMTEGDLLGLPKVDGEVTKWLPPEWLHTACNKPVVLFLDEVDRATTEVRQGIFELCDSRKIAGYNLHPDTLIFAAINGGDAGSQYMVNEMDPAELDRWTPFDVKPSVEDWLTWAKDRVAVEIWDFVNNNHQHLEHNDDYEPNKVYPSRRSWERLSQTVAPMGQVEHSPTVYRLTEAFCGMEAGIAFNDFLQNYDRQVTIEQILDEGKLDLVKDWKINDHNAFIEKFKAEKTFEVKLTATRLQHLANYFVTLPSEIAMTLWQTMGKCTDTAGYNIAKLHNITASNGVRVQDFIVSMLTSKSE